MISLVKLSSESQTICAPLVKVRSVVTSYFAQSDYVANLIEKSTNTHLTNVYSTENSNTLFIIHFTTHLFA